MKISIRRSNSNCFPTWYLRPLVALAKHRHLQRVVGVQLRVYDYPLERILVGKICASLETAALESLKTREPLTLCFSFAEGSLLPRPVSFLSSRRSRGALRQSLLRMNH